MAGFERGVRPIGDWSMSITLSKCSSPSTLSWGAGAAEALFSRRAAARYSVSMVKVDLPPPETPVMQVKVPDRDFAGHGLEVVAPRAGYPQQLLLVELAALLGDGNLACAGQVLAGDAALAGHDVGWRPLGDDLPTMHARGRTHVE